MAASSPSRMVIYAAFAGNLLVALTKFAAAWWTGSTAMFSEGVHSLVDTSNQLLLLYGIYRAQRPADENHPLGHGRELYFWSFVVALMMFTIGAGVTFYEGLQHVRQPVVAVDPHVNYVVLLLSMVFEGTTWWIAFREFRRRKGDLGYFAALRRSKDPPTFIVLFEDSAAMAGLIIALVGTVLAERLHMPVIDGIAALGISAVLAITAIVLARESKDLLIGEPASPRKRESILAVARALPGIERANVMFTVHLSPEQIVAALSLEFNDKLTTPEIEEMVLRLEQDIHRIHPDIVAVFIKPQTAGTFQSRRRLLRSSG